MASYKMLGQLNPAAATPGDLYPCSVAGGAVVSSVWAVNTGTTQAKVRIYVRVAGASLNVKQYLSYDDVLLPPGTNANSLFLTIGLSLANTDVISVYSDSSDVSFGATGVETP